MVQEHRLEALLYAGVASNACVLDKAVGMRHMQALGVEAYLARDLTAAQVFVSICTYV